jgi:hypothetical protein
MRLIFAIAVTGALMLTSAAIGLLAAHITRNRRRVDPASLAVLHAAGDEHMRSYR